MDPLNVRDNPSRHKPPGPTRGLASRLQARRPIAPRAFEIDLDCPANFDYHPGQGIALSLGGITRDYSMAAAPDPNKLTLLVGRVAGGAMTSRLFQAPLGTPVVLEGPLGHFIFEPGDAPPIFIAGGTGIAPFRAMVMGGCRDVMVLQGARTPEDAYYAAWLRQKVRRHVICLSTGGQRIADLDPGTCYPGRVTDYLQSKLPRGTYDFYVCGGPQLVRDTVRLIDDRFPASRVRTEIFT